MENDITSPNAINTRAEKPCFLNQDLKLNSGRTARRSHPRDRKKIQCINCKLWYFRWQIRWVDGRPVCQMCFIYPDSDRLSRFLRAMPTLECIDLGEADLPSSQGMRAQTGRACIPWSHETQALLG